VVVAPRSGPLTSPAFAYPLLMRGGRRMPVALMLLAIAFNSLNAWINARWVSQLGSYPTDCTTGSDYG
jgi:hypothetical protein